MEAPAPGWWWLTRGKCVQELNPEILLKGRGESVECQGQGCGEV